MIVAFVVLAIVLLLVIEFTLSKKLVVNIFYKSNLDKGIAEPGEPITLISEVSNYNKIFVPFLRLREYIPAEATLIDDKMRVFSGTFWDVLEKTLSIKRKERLTKFESFSVDKRGRYSFGDYEVSVGDIFGLQESRVSGAVPHEFVVIPRRAEDRHLKDVVEGFIGDISVRRFIMEDPVLTIGFNEYTGREPMKDISWTRTASRGQLMVKNYDHTTDINVTVMLNLDILNENDFEESLSVTRMVIESLESKKIPYAFRTNGVLYTRTGHLEYAPKGLGDAHVKEILYALATANTGRIYSFNTLVNRVLREKKDKSNYFLITGALSGSDEAALQRLQKSTDGEVAVITVDGVKS